MNIDKALLDKEYFYIHIDMASEPASKDEILRQSKNMNGL